MNSFDKFDDIEHLVEGVLVGLRARKEIEPLRKRISELEKAIEAFREECIKLREERDFEADLYKALKNDYDEINQQLDDEQKISSELKRSVKALSEERDKLRDEKDFETKLYKILRKDYDEANQQLDEEQRISSELRRSVKTLSGERDNLRDEKISLEKQVKTLTNRLDDANKKISESEAKRRDAEGTANFYRDTYGELDAAYKIYSTLNGETRFDLAGIFGAGDTAKGFLSGAVQESHLNSFWDYVSRHPDEENLQRLFDFCFAALNLGFREAPYTRLNVACGNDFDDEFMRRTSQSPQMGNVVRVVFQGYRYSSGNVVKKSVVELG